MHDVADAGHLPNDWMAPYTNCEAEQINGYSAVPTTTLATSRHVLASASLTAPSNPDEDSTKINLMDGLRFTAPSSVVNVELACRSNRTLPIEDLETVKYFFNLGVKLYRDSRRLTTTTTTMQNDLALNSPSIDQAKSKFAFRRIRSGLVDRSPSRMLSFVRSL